MEDEAGGRFSQVPLGFPGIPWGPLGSPGVAWVALARFLWEVLWEALWEVLWEVWRRWSTCITTDLPSGKVHRQDWCENQARKFLSSQY